MSNGPFHHPYGDEAKDFLYNLLFCDDAALFRPRDGQAEGPLAAILAPAPDIDVLREIAGDQKEESRYRALAFNRLRETGTEIPRFVLLGVIVENHMDVGLDVLAAFTDERVRYLNHAASPAIFEGAPEPVALKAAELVMRSQAIIDKIGPTDEPRRPPPAVGDLRLSFVVSDGLYFGEGPFDVLASDRTARAVVGCAGELLSLVVEAALKK